MNKLFGIIFVVTVVFSQATMAQAACRSSLTDEEIDFVKENRALVRGVDPRSLQRTVDELEADDCPAIQALIFEAMAKTYDDISRENSVAEQKKKEWLYSKIKLNMAYLQLTGGNFKGDSDPLNRRIRYLLKEYLGPEVLKHPAFFQKVKELLE